MSQSAGLLLPDRLILADQVVELTGAKCADHGANGRGLVDQGGPVRVARVAHGDRGRVQASELHARTLGVAALALAPDRAVEFCCADPVVNVLHRFSSPDGYSPARCPADAAHGTRAQGPARSAYDPGLFCCYAPPDLQN